MNSYEYGLSKNYPPYSYSEKCIRVSSKSKTKVYYFPVLFGPKTVSYLNG